MIERGDPLSLTRVEDLKGRPTCWVTLIVCFQMFSLRIKKLCCMCLKTTKQWSKWSLKEGVPQWDTFPEPTELLLIGNSIKSIWTLKSKSNNTLTPKTNSQTYWQRETSQVMSGIICWASLTLAISVLQSVLKWCRKEHKKIQVKKESQQSRNRWWIWSHDTAWRIRTCLPLLHQKARGKRNLKVKTYLSARWMCSKQAPGKPVLGASSSNYSEWNIDD